MTDNKPKTTFKITMDIDRLSAIASASIPDSQDNLTIESSISLNAFLGCEKAPFVPSLLIVTKDKYLKNNSVYSVMQNTLSFDSEGRFIKGKTSYSNNDIDFKTKPLYDSFVLKDSDGFYELMLAKNNIPKELSKYQVVEDLVNGTAKPSYSVANGLVKEKK